MTEQKEMNKLFIGNLSWDTKWWDLKEFFGQFGEVAYASTAFDREKRRPRGFGFVTFINEADAAKAKEASADGQLVLHERPLFIDFAIPKDDADGEEHHHESAE
ncbi:MAG: RNA-binding protein [Candidatus Peribacteria bacterium]|nr:MAG: RNA-binding protein [Candidatus Peribacteria bacterium]